MCDNKNPRKGRRSLKFKRSREKTLQYFRSHKNFSLITIFILACVFAYLCTLLPELVSQLFGTASLVFCVYLAFKWKVIGGK